jgi:hypothetical protein
MRKNLRYALCSALFLSALTSSLCSSAFAQDVATSDLPDAPACSTSVAPQQPQPPATPATAPDTDPQQKRIFGILPNFRAVSAGTTLPPQTVKEKLTTTLQDSFDYTSFIVAGFSALTAFLLESTPEFHQGAAGYGRYYWHAFVDQTSENTFVEFIVPSIAHEDTRYYSLGKGGFLHRAGYSISRIVITRSDRGGGPTFNSSEVLGAAFSAALSNAYYPAPERTFGNTFERYGTNLGVDAGAFLFREFYPDIYHAFFHKKIGPATP